jgi:putative transposase
VSINVEIPDQLTTCENQAVVGVDLGIKTLATLSTGEKFEAPKPLAQTMERLQRLGRQLSRKQKGSQNREKARARLARLHYRIACVRADALHKLTTVLVRRFGTIVIEDLDVRGMYQNRNLSRAISDVGFFEFRRQLKYKSTTQGVRVVTADRWFPSSKTCSDCGFVVDILPLSVREWACPECGSVHDRDVNAAVNLEQLPEAIREVTPVERKALARTRVRAQPSSVKQEFCRALVSAQKK